MHFSLWQITPWMVFHQSQPNSVILGAYPDPDPLTFLYDLIWAPKPIPFGSYWNYVQFEYYICRAYRFGNIGVWNLTSFARNAGPRHLSAPSPPSTLRPLPYCIWGAPPWHKPRAFTSTDSFRGCIGLLVASQSTEKSFWYFWAYFDVFIVELSSFSIGPKVLSEVQELFKIWMKSLDEIGHLELYDVRSAWY